ncbi:MAG: glutaredoxin family protein [Ornithinimicrobium sp.]
MAGHEAGVGFAALVPSADDRGRPVRVSVLTRVGCHLCDRALAAIDEVSRPLGIGYWPVDVDAQEPELRHELLARYGEWLPVIFVDGRAHDYWSIDSDRLRQSLLEDSAAR